MVDWSASEIRDIVKELSDMRGTLPTRQEVEEIFDQRHSNDSVAGSDAVIDALGGGLVKEDDEGRLSVVEVRYSK